MKNSTTCVLFLVARIDSETGGLERQAFQLASALQRRACRIFFVTAAYWNEMRANGLPLVGALGPFTVYRVPIFRGWRHLNALLYFFGALFLLLRFRSRYHIIHAHELHSSGLIACAAKLLMSSKKVVIKVPAAGRAIGDVQYLGRLPASAAWLSLARGRADTVVGVTDQIRAELHNAGFRRVVVIPNGVDTDRFAPLSSSEARAEQKVRLLGSVGSLPVILFVGRLGPEKNVQVLLEALRFLSRKVLLLIVGDGEMRGALENLAREHRGTHEVLFWGIAEEPEHLYGIADVFVLPSLSEGLPNVILEAMSCGVPAVGSDIPGIRSVITDDANGHLFTDGARELARKIDRILADGRVAERLSAAGRRTVLERFSLGTVADQYCRLYASLSG